ncbi:DUF1376 domain-containing protein [Bartonella sp. DGB2]|uniref:DUF1376 domain-containing protein n=1 Tax=Bartonella sp. DGB2 TaxID=3388426 RepID=UPI00398FD724
MNSAMPWVKFSPCDWIVGTLGLMPEQKGVYIDLLMLMYERKAPVKFDIAFLSRAFGCSQNKLRKIIDELVRLEKIIITQAGIWNARVEKMLAGFEDDKERHEDLSEKRRKAGLASVQAKSIKKQHVSEGIPTNAQQNFNKRSTNAQQNSTHVDHIEEEKRRRYI